MLFRSDLRFAEGRLWDRLVFGGQVRASWCSVEGLCWLPVGGARRSSIKSMHSATSTAQPQRFVLNKWLRGAGSSVLHLQYLMPLVLYSTSTGRRRRYAAHQAFWELLPWAIARACRLIMRCQSYGTMQKPDSSPSHVPDLTLSLHFQAQDA